MGSTVLILAATGCGSGPCPELTCDDVVNVVFSQTMGDQYTVEFEGTVHRCDAGTPSGSLMTQCSADGFVLKTSTERLNLLVQGENWHGRLDAQINALDMLNETNPECAVPCRRAETSLLINEGAG